MAIVNTVASGYFVLDTPDIRWNDAAQGRMVVVTIAPLNGIPVTFTEQYTPDDNHAVTLRGLSALLQPYVSPCPTSSATFRTLLTNSGAWIATLSRAQWTATLYQANGTTRVGDALTSYAYYASQRTSTRPGLSAIWLSRYTSRDIVPSQPLIGCFMMMSGVTARLRVYYNDGQGVLHETVVTPSLNGAVATDPPSQAVVLHYTLSALASAISSIENTIIDKDNIVQVDFELLEGNSVADTLRYRIDREHKKMLRLLAFTNCFGMLETEAFVGSEEEDTVLDAEFSYLDENYEKISQQLVGSSRLCAGHVNDERRRSIRDIATSPEVYLIRRDGSSCFEQMTVTDMELKDQRPHTTFQTAFVTLRPSHRHQETVSRGQSISQEESDGVFDYTFDDSFN